MRFTRKFKHPASSKYQKNGLSITAGSWSTETVLCTDDKRKINMVCPKAQMQ